MYCQSRKVIESVSPYVQYFQIAFPIQVPHIGLHYFQTKWVYVESTENTAF